MLVFVTGSWCMPKQVVKLVHVQLTMNCFQLFFTQLSSSMGRGAVALTRFIWSEQILHEVASQ